MIKGGTNTNNALKNKNLKHFPNFILAIWNLLSFAASLNTE